MYKLKVKFPQKLLQKDTWDIFLLIITIGIFFNITVLFNYSSDPIWRLFTDFKVIYAVFFIALFKSVLGSKNRAIWNIEGKKMPLLIILSVFISNYSSPEVQFPADQVISVSSCVILYFLIVCYFNTWHVERFLKVIPVVIIIMLIFGKLFSGANDIIAQIFHWTSDARGAIVKIKEGQTCFTGIFGLTKRSNFLWMDANNWAYLLSFSILITFSYLLSSKDPLKKLSLYAIFLSLLLFLLATYSRGGFLATSLALLYLLLFYPVNVNRKFATGLIILLLGLTFGTLFFSNIVIGLLDRIMLAIGMFDVGYGKNYYGGLETGRIITMHLAWKEFLEKPILGWGGILMGQVSMTGNHLHYLNILGQFGIVGASFYFTFYGYIFLTPIRTIKRLKSEKRNNRFVYILMAFLIVLMIRGFFAPLHFVYWIVAGSTVSYCRRLLNQSPAEID